MKQIRFETGNQNALASGARKLAALVAMGGVILLAAGAAAVLTVAALAVFAILLAAGAGLYLFAMLKRGRKNRGERDPRVLDARKGPSGWTVDTAGRYGH